MSVKSESSNESVAEQDTTEPRTHGGHDFLTLHRTESTVAVLGNQQEHIRQALFSFFMQFMAKALSFVISLILSTFSSEPQGNNTPVAIQLTESLQQRLGDCKHPAHKNLAKTALIHEIPASYFELVVQDHKRDKKLQRNNVANANNSLNASFIKRLVEIEARAPNSTALKLLSYQEWVDMLLKINKVLLKNLCELEAEFSSSVEKCCSKNADKTKLLASYQADVTKLILIIKQAARDGCWNVRDRTFETFDASEVFGAPKNQTRNKERTREREVFDK